MNEEMRETTITIKDLVNVLLKRLWIILSVSVLAVVGLFIYMFVFTAQYYEAKGLMYVNNKSLNIGISSITQGDISAQKSLVQSYSIILTTRSTIEDVLERANLKDKYEYEDVIKMLTVGSVNSTEIFSISCKCEDGADAVLIVTTILNTFPAHVENIIDGSSASVVDYPSDTATPVKKGYTRNSILAFLIAFVVSYGFFFVLDVLIDDTIKSSDWIKETYKDVAPLLTIVPDVNIETKHKYAYYNYYSNNGEEKEEE